MSIADVLCNVSPPLCSRCHNPFVKFCPSQLICSECDILTHPLSDVQIPVDKHKYNNRIRYGFELLTAAYNGVVDL